LDGFSILPMTLPAEFGLSDSVKVSWEFYQPNTTQANYSLEYFILDLAHPWNTSKYQLSTAGTYPLSVLNLATAICISAFVQPIPMHGSSVVETVKPCGRSLSGSVCGLIWHGRQDRLLHNGNIPGQWHRHRQWCHVRR